MKLHTVRTEVVIEFRVVISQEGGWRKGVERKEEGKVRKWVKAGYCSFQSLVPGPGASAAPGNLVVL